MNEIEKLLEIMARLRHPETGCPWDVEQTFATVAPYTIEEAYEVADAIAREDWSDLKGELGDLLFQVVFHARMAEEKGEFDFADVAAAIADKLTRRHPHVFGSDTQRSRGAAAGSWERIKAEERAEKARRQRSSALDDIPLSLPALKRATKLGKRAASVGFDWPDVGGVRAKVDEELEEVGLAVGAGDAQAVYEEIGDLLFSIANLSRHLGVDPEAALGSANRKFEQRFRGIEDDVGRRGRRLEDLDLDDLESLWQAQKSR